MHGSISIILLANERSHWVLSYKIVSNDLDRSLFATEAQKFQKIQSYIVAAIDFNEYNLHYHLFYEAIGIVNHWVTNPQCFLRLCDDSYRRLLLEPWYIETHWFTLNGVSLMNGGTHYSVIRFQTNWYHAMIMA